MKNLRITLPKYINPVISTLKIAFTRLRIIIAVIIIVLLLILLSIGYAPSVSPGLNNIHPVSYMYYYYNNDTYHVIDLYYNQYGYPMSNACVYNYLTYAGVSIKEKARINNEGYAIVNFKNVNSSLDYKLGYYVPVIPPVKNVTGWSNGYSISAIPKISNNFTVFNAIPVYGQYVDKAAFILFYYNSNNYKLPIEKYRLFYTNRNLTITIEPPIFNETHHNEKYNEVNKTINIGNFGNFNYKLLYINYNNVPKNISKIWGFLQVYKNNSWSNVSVPGYSIPCYSPQLMSLPLEKQINNESYNMFFVFPAALISVMAIILELFTFGFQKSSNEIEIFISKSSYKSIIIIKRFLLSIFLMAITILSGLLAFTLSLHYYDDLYLGENAFLNIFVFLLIIGISFLSISFLVSSKSKSSITILLIPFVLFFFFFYIFNILLNGIYKLLIVNKISLNPFILYYLNAIDPFNDIIMIKNYLINNSLILPMGINFYILILIIWDIVPLLLSLIFWRKAY